MPKPSDWFAVDKRGLAQLLERKGKAFALLELVSNAWDQNVTQVDITLTPIGRGKYELVVTDDDPDGFADITHAFTLFAPSIKKVDVSKRGRFNLGEKLVLALCEEASITSTKSGVRFDSSGRHSIRARRNRGSEFRAMIRLTAAENNEICAVVPILLPPAGVITTFNGAKLVGRQPVRSFKAPLATEIADSTGNLRVTTRNTQVTLYEPDMGETPMIYELGIPVVENGDRWHYDVGQKVPLTLDRDNVKPAFLRHLRTLVLNESYGLIDEADANATWAKEAIEDPRVSSEAVAAVVERRFGDKVVIYDPSDPEANSLATSKGYTVVHGRSLSKEAWVNVKRYELIKPAGQVTPSSTNLLAAHFSGDGTGTDIVVPEEKWTAGQRTVVAYAREIGSALLGFTPSVAIVSDITLPYAAFYGGKQLTFNVGKLGHRWFNSPSQLDVDALLIHEYAHEEVSNHLDYAFHDECCRLGAVLRNVEVRLSA